MKIEHLVFSGGGPSGLLVYGAARYLSVKDVWNIKNIKTIYGSSVGAYMGFVFSLGYEWDILDDFFIKRPWNKVIDNTVNQIVDVYSKCGFIGDEFIIENIKSLLMGKDLNVNITMKELYDKTNIEIHMYTANINSDILEKIDISYKTHPELEVFKALRMTMAVPIAFEPVYIDDKCYIDGAIFNNLPLNDCINQTNADLNTILVFKNKKLINKNQISVTKESTLIDFIYVLIKKINNYICTESEQQIIKNTVFCNIKSYSIIEWFEILSSREMRETLIEYGKNDGELFYKSISDDTSLKL